MKKIILFVVLALVLAIGGGLYYLNTNLNALVKQAMEKYGSQITQTSVHVDNVDISLKTGKGSVSGISVGNPKSFIAATAINVGDVSLQLDKKSVLSNGPVIIDEVVIEKPSIVYEINPAGDGNLLALKRNIASASGGSKQASSDASDSKYSREVIIRNLYIRHGAVSVSHQLLKDKAVKADLPTIHLKDIGKNGKGVDPKEVANIVMSEVIKEASKTGQQALQKELLSIKGLDQKSIQDGVSSKLKSLF